MNIFISWSGDTSRVVAVALQGWLRKVLQASVPYVSSKDINKGARWFEDISKELEDSQFGIICLTRENLRSNWIHFEAGALAKNVSRSRVAPLLIGLTPTDIKPPLSQFQLVSFTKRDVYQLVEGLNASSSKLPESDLRETFDMWWPKLEEEVSNAQKTMPMSAEEERRQVTRTDRELLEELLETTRSTQREGFATFRDSVSIGDFAAYDDDTVELAILDTLYLNRAERLPKLLDKFVFPASLVLDAVTRLAARGHLEVQGSAGGFLCGLTSNGVAVYAGRSRQAAMEPGDEK